MSLVNLIVMVTILMVHVWLVAACASMNCRVPPALKIIVGIALAVMIGDGSGLLSGLDGFQSVA